MLQIAINKKVIANCFLIMFTLCNVSTTAKGNVSTTKQYKADFKKVLPAQRINSRWASNPHLAILLDESKARMATTIRGSILYPKSKRNFVKICGDGGVEVTGAPKQQLVEGANLVLFLQRYIGGSNLYFCKKIPIHIFKHSDVQFQRTKVSSKDDINDYASLTDVIFPKHLDGLESPVLLGGSTHPDFTGYPFIDMDGNPSTVEDQIIISERYFDWSIQWKDTEISKTKNTRTIKRRWIIIDATAGNTSINTQIIKQNYHAYD